MTLSLLLLLILLTLDEVSTLLAPPPLKSFPIPSIDTTQTRGGVDNACDHPQDMTLAVGNDEKSREQRQQTTLNTTTGPMSTMGCVIERNDKKAKDSYAYASSTVYGNMSLTFNRTLSVPNPAYTQILRKGVLSVTSFSLLKKGSISEFDLHGNLDYPRSEDEASSGSSNNGNSDSSSGEYVTPTRILDSSKDFQWPNELTVYNDRNDEEVMIVPDGFLTPGQSTGGLYLVRNLSCPTSMAHRITRPREGWFYHRAVHIRISADREGILTARAKKRVGEKGEGELVWIPLPQDDHYAMQRYTCQVNPDWGDELDDRGGAIEGDILDEVVLAQGPDVMFEVWDMDIHDDTVEVVTVNFFDECISVYSLKAIEAYPYLEVEDMNYLETVGRPYGICLANMRPGEKLHEDRKNDSVNGSCNDNTPNHNDDIVTKDVGFNEVKKEVRDNKNRRIKITSPSLPSPPHDMSLCDNSNPTHILISTHECSYDVSSGVSMLTDFIGGKFPMVKGGIHASSTKRQAVESGAFASEAGGALFAFEIPKLKSELRENKAWKRYTLFRGFKVRGFGGIVSPGAPGLPYVFRKPNSSPSVPPLVLLAGDCTGSAYVFAPTNKQTLGVTAEYIKNDYTSVKELAKTKENEKLGTLILLVALLPLFPIALFLLLLRYLREELPVGFISGWYIDNDFLGRNRKSSMQSIVNVWSPALTPSDRGLPLYEMMFEIESGATVGSAAVSTINDKSGDLELFIPSYEFNEINVYKLSSIDADNDSNFGCEGGM